MASLRSTRSKLDPRVSLITSPLKSDGPRPNSSTWPTPVSPPTYTSLRRTTRSAAGSSPSAEASTSDIKPRLDLGRFAHAQPPPSKRSRTSLQTPTTPTKPNVKAEPTSIRSARTPTAREPSVNHEPLTPLKPVVKGEEIKIENSEGSSTPKGGKKAMPLAARDRPHPAPAKWEEQYRLIERMRAGIVAPVDEMGCERPRTTDGLDAKTLRFHILISLMLSSQTKDAVTSQAVTNLHLTLPGGLTASSLASADADTVAGCINKVGFWRRKTEYIQDAARKLMSQEGVEGVGDVPDTIEGLCELKGVGPKMAFLALQCAWDINAGIGVDVHVHRITNRLKWHRPPTATPEQTRINLESWLPSHLHKPINPLLVGFGQVICLPVGPRCDICLLGQSKLCPSRVSVNAANRKEVQYTFLPLSADGEGSGGIASVKGEAEAVPGFAAVEVEYEEEAKVREAIKDEVEAELIVEHGEQIDGSVKVEPL